MSSKYMRLEIRYFRRMERGQWGERLPVGAVIIIPWFDYVITNDVETTLDIYNDIASDSNKKDKLKGLGLSHCEGEHGTGYRFLCPETKIDELLLQEPLIMWVMQGHDIHVSVVCPCIEGGHRSLVSFDSFKCLNHMTAAKLFDHILYDKHERCEK